jgi:hypothetical protein
VVVIAEDVKVKAKVKVKRGRGRRIAFPNGRQNSERKGLLVANPVKSCCGCTCAKATLILL